MRAQVLANKPVHFALLIKIVLEKKKDTEQHRHSGPVIQLFIETFKK